MSKFRKLTCHSQQDKKKPGGDIGAPVSVVKGTGMCKSITGIHTHIAMLTQAGLTLISVARGFCVQL